MMSAPDRWVVLKFGGSSVSTIERWHCIARIARARLEAGERPLLVCSALRGVTNRLEALAARPARAERDGHLGVIAEWHRTLARGLGLDADRLLAAEFDELERSARSPTVTDPAERANLLALGERMSTRLGAAWLEACSLPTTWVDARTLLRAEPAPAGSSAASRYLAGTCAVGPDAAVADRLAAEAAPVVITQGFTARDDEGSTVLLGRGGSDTSGAYLATRVSARRLEIWSDVPGLFTAHPGRYPLARLVTHLDYTEAEALAGFGARALHPRCLRPLRACNIPLRLGWTAHPEIEGTLIDARPTIPGLKAITARRDLYLLTMSRDPRWQPVGFMAQVAACFNTHGLSMDLITSSSGEIRATLDPSAFPGARDEVPALLRDLKQICEPEVNWDVGSVSLIGSDVFADVTRRAGDLLTEGPEVLMATHAPDDTSMSLVVEAEHALGVERYLHTRLLRTIGDEEHFGTTWRALLEQVETKESADAA